MNFVNSYVNFLKNYLKPKKRLKIVFDCSNGTTGLVLKELFRTYKLINFKLINCNPDGNFPGHGPNPLARGATKQLEKEIKRQKADLGVIFDADGDRVFFVDDRSRFISADEIGYILLRESKPASFVVSVISGWLLKKYQVSGIKCQIFVSRVGHYFFKKLMRKKKIPLGLEHSGHYYFVFGNAVWDSGILAAIKIINFVSCLNQPLSDYLDSLPKYYRSGEINFKVRDKAKVLKRVEKAYGRNGKINKLDGLTVEFSGPSARSSAEAHSKPSGQNPKGFWFNLRPSNTENLLRLNMEAVSKKILNQELVNIKKFIKI